jgi:hypothetical protein
VDRLDRLLKLLQSLRLLHRHDLHHFLYVTDESHSLACVVIDAQQRHA